MAARSTSKFTKRFRRLCQAAAVTGTDRSQNVVDGLLLVAMVYGDGPWEHIGDWIDSIEELFGLSLAKADVSAALERAIAARQLVFDSRTRQYQLQPHIRKATWERIEAGEELERTVQSAWLAEVEPLVSDIGSDKLWACLLGYAGRAFLAHGSDAVALLGDVSDVGLEIPSESPDALLRDAMSNAGISDEHLPSVSSAVRVFFDGSSPQRVAYIAELTDSTFNFLALGLDEECRDSLKSHLPELTIFVDTNVIYGMIGAHSSSLATASSDLSTVLRDHDFNFKIYYHEKTLAELERTMFAIGARLRARQWTPAISRARLNVPSGLTSIEIRYHEINAEVPTSTEVFLSKYSNLPALLADYGLTIFRESVTSKDEVQRRAELVAEYEAFSSQRRRDGREKPYLALDHDVTIWLAAAARQIPRRKGPLFSGALVLTADRLFRQFDRQVLAPVYGTGTWIATYPDILLQALRPFMSSTENYDSIFTQIFAAPEFRGIGGDLAETVNRVAAYLATFAGLSEKTATNLLANSMLMSQLKQVDNESGELRRIIEQELVRENEILARERDEFIAAAREAGEEAMRDVTSIQQEIAVLGARLAEDHEPEVGALVKKLEGLADQLAKFGPNLNFDANNVYVSETMTNYSGEHNEAADSNVGIQGSNAQVQNLSQHVDQRRLDVDFPDLTQELERLKQDLLRVAADASEYQAVAEVQAAKEAASREDHRSVVGHLQKAGQWALDAAKRLAIPVAEAAIKQSLGIGS